MKRTRRTRSTRRGRKNGNSKIVPASFGRLLAESATILDCTLMPEPALLFAGRQSCEDPKTGLLAFGPYSKTDVTRRTVVRLGVVGPSEAVDRALNLVERMAKPIPQIDTLDVMLHPSFPGVSEQDPFQGFESLFEALCFAHF